MLFWLFGEADGVTSWFLEAADVGADRCVQWVHGTLCCVVYRRVACVRVCSLRADGIGNDGAVAIAGALAHVPQLTTLEYVVLVLVLVVVVCAWVVGMWRLYGVVVGAVVVVAVLVVWGSGWGYVMVFGGCRCRC